MLRVPILSSASGCGCPLCHTGKHESLNSLVKLMFYTFQLGDLVDTISMLEDSDKTAGQKIMAAEDSSLQVIMVHQRPISAFWSPLLPRQCSGLDLTGLLPPYIRPQHGLGQAKSEQELHEQTHSAWPFLFGLLDSGVQQSTVPHSKQHSFQAAVGQLFDMSTVST